MSIKSWFGNAFSSPVEENLTEEERERENKLFDKIAKAIVKRNLTIPAIMFLEIHTPLGYMASQLAHGLGPFTSLVIKPEDMTVFAEAIGRRDGLDKLIQMIEAKDKEKNDNKDIDKNDSKTNSDSQQQAKDVQQQAEREV